MGPTTAAAKGVLGSLSSTGRKADTRAVILLGILTLLFFGRILFTDQALYFGDAIMGVYPAHDLWRQYVHQGDLPVWNPYIMNGMPFLADAEFSSFYPSMLLNLVLPLSRALAADLALHVFLLAALTYAFLRRRGLAWSPAFLGACTFAFSGFLAARITQPNLIRTMTWLPLQLLIVAGIDFQRSRWRPVLALGATLALQVFAGHLQTLLISLLLAGSFALWRAARDPEAARTLRGRLIVLGLTFVSAAALGLILAAVQVLPAVEMVRHSDRSGGRDFTFATSFSLPLRQLPMLLAPNLFGTPFRDLYWGAWLYWEMVGFAGVAAVLLALVGLAASVRRDRWLWAVIGACGVALAVGRSSLLYRLAYLVIPGLDYFRVPSRFLIWYAWAVAVLAAYGLEALRARAGSSRAWRALALLLVLVAGGALYWGLGGPGVVPALERLAEGAMRTAQYLPPTLFREVVRLAGAIGVAEGLRLALLWVGAGTIVFAALSRRLRVRLAEALLIALVVGDLFSYGMNLYPTVKATELTRPLAIEDRLRLGQGTYRVFTTPAFAWSTWLEGMTRSAIREPEELAAYRAALVPNTGVLRRIANAWGYSPVELLRSNQFITVAVDHGQRREGRSPLIDFMGARYIFTRAYLPRAYARLYKDDRDGYHVWYNDRALPRGFLVTRFVVQPVDGSVQRILDGNWEPRQVVILSEPPRETFTMRPRDDPGQILRRSYGLSRLTFDLALNGPAVFVLSDTYYPGWRAYIDGREAPIYRANHAFRAVVLPAETRRLEFVFQPRSVQIGGGISILGWGILAAVVLVRGRQRP